jgi:hypothetical protein
VDEQSLKEFEESLTDQSLSYLESNVVGELLPTPGESGSDSKEIWW